MSKPPSGQPAATPHPGKSPESQAGHTRPARAVSPRSSSPRKAGAPQVSPPDAAPLRDVAEATALVDFWRRAGSKKWFGKDEAFDEEVRSSFTSLHLAAARRELDHWIENAEGALALMVLLDQFPRNCFRGTAHMYATDPLARRFARMAIAKGHDQRYEADLRQFFYLPLMHSEELADQDTSVALCNALSEENARFARHHRDIIARFGRFPHRNPVLARESTAKEKVFLDAGGFSG